MWKNIIKWTLSIVICDMIKRNESDVGHIVFEILAKTVFKFLCFILFLALTNSSKLCNQISNCYGVWIKMEHVAVMRKWCKIMGINIFDNWLISLDHVTYKVPNMYVLCCLKYLFVTFLTVYGSSRRWFCY